MLGSTDLYFVEDIEGELAEATSNARSALTEKKQRAVAYGEYLPPDVFKRLEFKRRSLGRFHQKVTKHRGRLIREREGDGLPPMEEFFFNAAKNMLPQPDFQRLVLIAEQRRLVAANDAKGRT